MKAALRLTVAAFVLAAFNITTVAAIPDLVQILDGGLLTPALEPVAGDYAPGELLVKFTDGPTSYSAYMAHAGLGAEVLRNFREIGWQHVKLPGGMSVADGLTYYQSLESVAAVEPNYVRYSTDSSGSATSGVVPNDPMFKSQWNLLKIGATNAWSITTGSTNVVVADIGSGVDYTHEDLAANMWRNPGETGLDENGKDKASNGLDDDGDGYVDDVVGIDTCDHNSNPMDTAGHDTAVAGIIGAVGNNLKGIVGVNWHVSIMALRSHGLPGLIAYDSMVIEAFEYVIMMKKHGVNVRVTNNSYAGDENGQAIKDAIDAAGNLAILNVFAAGNAGQNNDGSPIYPASFDSPSILSVAATSSNDSLASFSNYGRKSVDLAAPGDSIISTAPSNRVTGKSQYSSGLSGTSFATPHVSGAAALLLSVNPTLSVADLKSALLGTVDLPRSLTNKVASNGRLNVARAVQFLVDSNAPSIVTSVFPCGNQTPPTAQVELTFTKPMDRASVEAGFSLSPAVSGTFEWSNNDRTVTFIPATSFLLATNYTGKMLGSAKDTNGVTLDGNYDRVPQGTNRDDFTWSFRTTPTNDDFAAAEAISGSNGSVSGTNRNATKENGEPNHAANIGGASVWYHWTAPSGDWVTFDTAGTRFDTLLAVYTRDKVDALTQVAINDNYSTLKTSRLSFAPVAGATYFLAVDAKVFLDPNNDAPAMGSLVLNWYPTPPPVFQSAQEFMPNQAAWGTQVILNGTNFTGVTGVSFGDVSAQFTNNSDLRITVTVPVGAEDDPVTIHTAHGEVTSSASFVSVPMVLYTFSRTELGLWVDWAGNAFVLEYTESLAQPAWTAAPQMPTTVEGGGRTVLVLPFEGSAKFYRWRKG